MSALLQIQDMTHAFGGVVAVKDFSLSVEEHEIVGLIGPNGAGKTTVFNLITGVYRPRQGSICFNGHSLVGLPPHLIARKGIARTFQTIRLYGDLTVLDNVSLGSHSSVTYTVTAAVVRLPVFYQTEEAIRKRALSLLEMFGLLEYARVPASALPYGLQRRLEMCRALASRPRMVLLDEPAAGMNPREVQEMVELIRWMHKEFSLTTILIEHHMQLVMEVCPRILAMDFGQVIAEGPPEYIQSHPRVVQAYLGTEEAV